MKKLTTATEIGRAIPDGSTIAMPGNASLMTQDALCAGIEASFLETGHPRGVTIFQPCTSSLGPGTGIERFAHRGLLKRVITSSFPYGSAEKPSQIVEMLLNGEAEGYSLPMGVLYSLAREAAAGRPGLLTEVGLHTFVDPTNTGGKVNPITREDLVLRQRIGGRDYLFYRTFPIHVALVKGTTADADGNITMEHEPTTLGALPLALAAKANGGKVYVQVSRLVEAGTLDPRQVILPGCVVDGVVFAPDAPQSAASDYDWRVTGEAAAYMPRTTFPAGTDRVILARAAAFLREGWTINVGVGIGENLPRLLHEAACDNLITTVTEHGAVGGLPCPRPAFGAHINEAAVLDAPDMFNFYTGGGLDATFLGLAETDGAGNVNVSQFGGVLRGPGGFIDISVRTRRVFICGNLTAGGAMVRLHDGKVVVERDGQVKKLRETVSQITLSGPTALAKGQTIRMITERGLFQLCESGWLLEEVAPGIDPDRDIAPAVEFPFKRAPKLRVYAPEIMAAPGPDFDDWLGRQLRSAEAAPEDLRRRASKARFELDVGGSFG